MTNRRTIQSPVTTNCRWETSNVRKILIIRLSSFNYKLLNKVFVPYCDD